MLVALLVVTEDPWCKSALRRPAAPATPGRQHLIPGQWSQEMVRPDVTRVVCLRSAGDLHSWALSAEFTADFPAPCSWPLAHGACLPVYPDDGFHKSCLFVWFPEAWRSGTAPSTALVSKQRSVWFLIRFLGSQPRGCFSNKARP